MLIWKSDKEGKKISSQNPWPNENNQNSSAKHRYRNNQPLRGAVFIRISEARETALHSKEETHKLLRINNEVLQIVINGSKRCTDEVACTLRCSTGLLEIFREYTYLKTENTFYKIQEYLNKPVGNIKI